MCNEGIKVYYFSLEEYLGCEGSISCVIFCLDSCRGQVSHNRQFDEKGVALLWICNCNRESVDHLLLHCGEVFWLWSFALRFFFCVSWVLPEGVIDLLAGWRNWLGMHFSNV